MPIYAYECGACGAAHDFLQKMGEGRKRKCPSCGALRLRKQVTAAAFHLKGTGWYATDFRDKDKNKKKEPEEGTDKKKQDGESKTEATGKKDSPSSADTKSTSTGKAPASKGGGGSSAGASAD